MLAQFGGNVCAGVYRHVVLALNGDTELHVPIATWHMAPVGRARVLHSVHTLLAAPVEKRPLAQLEQVEAPSLAENVPAPQLLHAKVLPNATLCVPLRAVLAAHGVAPWDTRMVCAIHPALLADSAILLVNIFCGPNTMVHVALSVDVSK